MEYNSYNSLDCSLKLEGKVLRVRFELGTDLFEVREIRIKSKIGIDELTYHSSLNGDQWMLDRMLSGKVVKAWVHESLFDSYFGKMRKL